MRAHRLGPIALLLACGDVHGVDSSGTAETSTTAAGTGAPDPTTTGDSAGDIGDPDRTIRFAVIGDYGADLASEGEVAAMIAARNPDFIITVGDNNYYDGAASTIDRNIGKYYHDFIAPYHGEFGRGATVNRFFPSPGNHDWNTGTLKPYTDYFDLPNNERYYSFRRGPVHFFAVDSDVHEPDGYAADSLQAYWLEQALADSDAPFKVVYFHHAPYSSGIHRGTTSLRWPFRAWGADVVLTGHDHHYERLVVDDLLYFVNGSGGAALRAFTVEEVGTQRATPDVFGAMFIEADPETMTLSFVSPPHGVVDRVTIVAEPPTTWRGLVPSSATWRFTQGDPGPDWTDLAADVDAWSHGPAPLGIGIGGEATVLPAPSVVTYFRHVFLADDSAVGAPLRLRLAADDGAVVYLNGEEIYRINMPEGTPTPTSKASTAVGWWYETRLAETMIVTDALQPGANLLAVELHQHSALSDDLWLAAELVYGLSAP